MRIDWRQQIVRVVTFIATLYNVLIVREAVTIPFLRGSALAQADLSLFMTLIFFGIPVLLACLGVLSFTLVGIRRAIREQNHSSTVRAVAAKNPIVLIVLGNVLIQGIAWAFMLYIMKYGLDAVTDWTG